MFYATSHKFQDIRGRLRHTYAAYGWYFSFQFAKKFGKKRSLCDHRVPAGKLLVVRP